MNGFRFYADLTGTLGDNDKPLYTKRTTREQLREAAARGLHCNVIAMLLGREHLGHDWKSQECLSATFFHADSDTSLGAVSFDYLRDCRRIDEALARKLHPRLFTRLDANEG